MYKKIALVLLVIIFCVLLSIIFKKTPEVIYSLDSLKDLLGQTETMVVCRNNYSNPYQICSNEEIIKTITDKSKIEQIVSLIKPLEVVEDTSTMEGAALVVHALDENGNLLVNFFYSPYIKIEKGDSSYSLGRDSQTIQSITEIFNIDTEKLLLLMKQ